MSWEKLTYWVGKAVAQIRHGLRPMHPDVRVLIILRNEKQTFDADQFVGGDVAADDQVKFLESVIARLKTTAAHHGVAVFKDGELLKKGGDA